MVEDRNDLRKLFIVVIRSTVYCVLNYERKYTI